MFTTPGATPPTTPALTVAMPVLLLIHDPPLGVPVKVRVLPAHTAEPPVIEADALTVTLR